MWIKCINARSRAGTIDVDPVRLDIASIRHHWKPPKSPGTTPRPALSHWRWEMEQIRHRKHGGGIIFFKSSNNDFVDLYLIFISETCCFTIQDRGFRYIMFPLFRHTNSGKAWNANLNLEKAFPPYCTMILKPYFSIFDRTWTAHWLIDRGIADFLIHIWGEWW